MSPEPTAVQAAAQAAHLEQSPAECRHCGARIKPYVNAIGWFLWRHEDTSRDACGTNRYQPDPATWATP